MNNWDNVEQPRAEYPFRAPPEPTALTQLYDVDNSFSQKREYVRRSIESGNDHFSLWFCKSIKELAQEVGLWDYYQSKQEGKRERTEV